MEAYQANGQSVRLQKVQIVQAAPSGTNLQQATLNGQPVLLQVLHFYLNQVIRLFDEDKD